MEELSSRRFHTVNRLKEVRSELHTLAANRVRGKACVYATGSFGRCEASPHSDLDIFILGKTDEKVGEDGRHRRLLGNLDEICLKADLIDITRRFNIPEFSGEGRYLVHYSVNDLTKTLGTPEDDHSNTFTARLLLLLESKALLEDAVYNDIIEDVIAAYWRDYEDHKIDFMPAFVANDILRLWRTFCVNYEARTKNISERDRIKRRVNNYKLKHSRLLTCFSAVMYMLAVFKTQKTVSPGDMVEITKLTPTERLERLRDQPCLRDSKNSITKLLHQYEKFLETTNADEQELFKRFSDKEKSAHYMREAYTFGDLAFDVLSVIGKGDRFFRLLVV